MGRDRLTMKYAILRAVRSGAHLQSSIVRRANLSSFDCLKRLLKELLDDELVRLGEPSWRGVEKVYLTSKGLECLELVYVLQKLKK